MAILLPACANQSAGQEPCRAAEAPSQLTQQVPDWQLKPAMKMWGAKRGPYPVTYITYDLEIRNTGGISAGNIHVLLGSDLFGWNEMELDQDFPTGPNTCPELPAGQVRRWSWKHMWNNKPDPAWKKTMEEDLEIRLVWESGDRWYEVRGHLPSQYAPAVYSAAELRPLKKDSPR